jgi:hypothetical protein
VVLAKHLTKQDIEAIVNLILGWSDEKLSWDAICEASEALVGKKPTRQSLNNNQAIKDAFTARKSGIRQVGIHKPKPSNLNVAADRIFHLQAENDMLKKKNAALLEQFVKWQYNAYKHGMTEAKLNESMPMIDRERTDN